MQIQYSTNQQAARLAAVSARRVVRSCLNRWGNRLTVGQSVSVQHLRGGTFTDTVTGFETTGEFARAYGERVNLASGMSASVDDCQPITP